ncbi:MAG: hypothetical protein O7A09_11315 [Proteobacteria bacterium]|nr:hypothetical protein [Pseudomonadota bacterium]MCZ6782218.1 hypothetical protein [Pseudomonadota bacterium]
MSIAFVACVEPGRLESEAVLLFRSIRRYAGRYRDARIASLQPRCEMPLAAETLAAFRELDVEHRALKLNTELPDYPVGNKVFASAWAEENLDEETLVFVDSDSLFTGEPTDLDLDSQRDSRWDAAVRPVNQKNAGSTGPDDRKDRYWLRLYELCGVSPGPFVDTAVSRERIRGYWNAGLVAARRSAGLFGRWRDNLRRLVAASHLPWNGMKNLDQLALAAALAAAPGRVRVLDGRYNYPLPKRDRLTEPLRSAPLEALVHVHYFRWLHQPGFLDRLVPPLAADSEIAEWLAGALPLEPRIDDPARKTR